jgi:hypothetical protein
MQCVIQQEERMSVLGTLGRLVQYAKPQSYTYVLQLQTINVKPDIHSPNKVTAWISGFGKLILHNKIQRPISILTQLKLLNMRIQCFSKILFHFILSLKA